MKPPIMRHEPTSWPDELYYRYVERVYIKVDSNIALSKAEIDAANETWAAGIAEKLVSEDTNCLP